MKLSFSCQLLLIGILGKVGSGKTSLLCRLADWWRVQGRSLDGFVARAGERPEEGRGAERYDLELLRDSRRLPYAVRDPALQPPYRFDPEAARELDLWADGLGGGDPPSLVIIDELGPVEAAGGGHMALWSRIVLSNPGVIVVAVRSGEESGLKERLGTDLIRAYDSIITWGAKLLNVRTPGLLVLIAGWSVACGAVSCLLTLIAWKRRQHMPGRLRDAVFRKRKGIALGGKPASRTEAMKRGLRDLLRPLFWLPVLIVVAFTLASGSPLESALWVVVRAAGIGFVLFSLVRVFDMHRFIAWLQARGHWGPALAYRHALDTVRPKDDAPRSPGKDSSSH